MSEQTHAIHWFEIPARDLGRAQAFYEKLLGRPLRREAMGGSELAVFASSEQGVGGCLVAGGDAPRPADGGTRVYLNAEPSLEAALARAAAAGGRVVLPKTLLPGEMGAYALVADSEGNIVGLHAQA
jgi:predicted enzyme related to lactoylglutathione lyase